MSAYPHILGVDIGSVSIAVVVLNSNQEIIGSAYEFHHGHTAQKLKEILNRFDLKAVGGIGATAATPPHSENNPAL
jgi:activator of 2-hydroxyglutaryl-CoA dehydratase